MSLYFDVAFACDLKPDVPQEVLDTLRYMTRVEDYAFDPLFDHEFFADEGWRYLLQIDQQIDRKDGEWTCSPGFVGSDLRRRFLYTKNWEDVYCYTLSFRRTMHDDVEFFELWWDFLSWIAPYSETTGYVGYYREEFTLHPTLIYFKNGKIFSIEVTQTPEGLEGDSWY